MRFRVWTPCGRNVLKGCVSTMDPKDAFPEYTNEVPARLLLSFDKADVISPMIEPPQPRLVVTGVKPYAAMEVSLVPLAYVRRPVFWEIQVVGTPGAQNQPTQLPADPSTPYTVELDITGLTGSVGIEVKGADQAERIAVATGTPK